jgi:hypothetical protein
MTSRLVAEQLTELGREAGEIIENESGGLWSRALTLVDLENAAYAAEETFSYDENVISKEIVDIVKALRSKIDQVSLRGDGALTLKRYCSKCSGAGVYDELVDGTYKAAKCDDCQGKGYFVPEE